MTRNTPDLLCVDRDYRESPSVYHPFLQDFSAEVAAVCFPVLLLFFLFSTLRPVRRTRFYYPRAGIFLGVEFVFTPLTGASATCSSY